MKFAIYGASSAIATAFVITNAFLNRSNFYAACIYLTESSACLMVLMNIGLFLAAIVGKLIQRLFFGPLRAIEVEHLYERTWYSITETCLAMTIFRNNFDMSSIIVFIILIFLKTFHWLCLDRLEFTRQSGNTSWKLHARIIISIIILLIVDVVMTRFSVNTVLREKPNMMLMFAFEFAILTSTITGAAIRYIFNLIDSYHHDNWENKGLYILYLELVMELFKLIAYSIFFMLALTFYGLPLHIIRDVYMTLKSFLSKCRDLILYKRVIDNMNQRFVDATFDEIAATEDKTCIICREEMIHSSSQEVNKNNKLHYYVNNTPKKLPCNHILHFNCLKSWLERQQTCPTCRRPVLENQSREIFNLNGFQIFNFFRNLGRRNEVSDRNEEMEQNRSNTSQNTHLFHNYRFSSGWTVIPLTNQDIRTIHNIINDTNSDTFISNNAENINQNKQSSTDSSQNITKEKNNMKESHMDNINFNLQYAFPEKLNLINTNTQKSSPGLAHTTNLDLTEINSALLHVNNIKNIEESNKLLLQAQEKISQSLQILKNQEQLQKKPQE